MHSPNIESNAAPTFKAQLKALGYLLVFIIPALMPFSVLLAREVGYLNWVAWLPLFALFVVLPLADYAIGRDRANPDRTHLPALEAQRYYRWLTLLCVPAYLGSVAFSMQFFAAMSVAGEFNAFGQLGWILSQGVIGGVVAINVAHELIHKSEKLESNAGGVLLASVCYGTFKIEHVRGHHVHVSTLLDASSARFGQTVYGFLLQSVRSNVHAGFALEAKRLQKLGLRWWSPNNEALQWSALSALFLLVASISFGWLGALFFVGQSLMALVSLEIINYIEHYGLEREKLPDGRYERTTHLHSWNSNYLLTNLILFQLQRHSDHHENPKRRYQALLHYDQSPQLPGGYAAMFLLALCPPLWFKVINPLVPGNSKQ